MELAGTLARELQELKADLATDAAELTETEEAYTANQAGEFNALRPG